MRHRDYEPVILAAIEDILERGRAPDWAPPVRAIQAEPFGEMAEKTLRICTTRDIYGSSKLFQRVIETARRASSIDG